MELLIVESPSKAKTIKKYLGNNFKVMASVGHIKDLPEKELGVDLQHDFKPKYVTIKGKSKIISNLKESAQSAQRVYLAPDPDREGEAIAWHIANVIDVPSDRVQRVLFNEITESGIRYGLSHPRQIDMSLVNAQQARRVLDRLVGYQVSPFLWRTLYSGLSAGRVQSVAVRIICEREVEIEQFIPLEYWEITALLQTPQNEKFSAKLIKIDNKKTAISNASDANKHLAILKNATYQVSNIEEKEVTKSPAPPFTTSTLQQEATRRFRYSPEKTMRIAQNLYEGVEIGGEPVGLITYMRTDSVRISKEAITGIREYIEKHYGAKFLPPNPRHFKTTKRNVQDAHEGIRPTHFEYTPEVVAPYLSPEQKKLYTLIWNRFAACQMSAAVYKQKIIDVTADNYLFRATGSDLIFDGYLRAWRQEKAEDEKKIALPINIQKDDRLTLLELQPEQKFTEPPPRFTEGTLIKELDNLGIGRPSTYATIVSTIITRKYVERKGGYLVPTDLGKTVNKLLVDGMPDIFNVKFTARMEAELDDIEGNRKEWQKVISEFYQPFHKSLEELQAQRREIKTGLQEKTDEKCEICGAPMVIKWSRNGRFLACSAFPKCKNTRPLNTAPVTPTESKTCPNCGSPMTIKDGRFGKFWACTKYPKCKTTEPFTLNINCPEPGCDGQIVQKRTKKGKIFYG
ncbi:MAG TPA: type I DNA topoisomerase, partial [Candidatus Marinimicrobia bacterium]|nr:type I DNA topoisomerase [Candidatus Neomarinimicrobiota bacterium]